MNSVSSRYKNIIEKLNRNEGVILDGATGRELESRGVKMENSGCGTASLEGAVLKQRQKD